MGDRSTPMKFGPEWLRNLAPGTSGSGGINHNTAMPSSPTASASGGQSGGATPTSSNAPNTSTNHSSKVLLAKLRYGREEMLALYDRNSEAPPELKFIELLYQPRGKPPFALNNTFEDEMRENMRSGSQMVTASLGERLNLGRGMGRGLSVIEGRGRARMPFVRQPSTGRGSSMWHHSSPRMPAFSGGGDDDSSLNLRSSWTGSNGGNAPNRNTGEQAEWTPSKMFRSKRQGQATNWRQAREEGEEWRSPDGGRSRERDWGDRPTQDKPQSWSTNRRTWVGGDTQNDDNLPEWAVDNAEACGGTFDSSGAFHGYSSDDTSLPKNQDTAHPLTRSHTHGSFARSKTVEEGSEEWWASEKAKKLSPKRFDASDVKFKKQTSVPEPSVISSDSTSGPANEDQIQDSWTNLDALSIQAFPETQDNASGGLSDDEKFKNFKPNQMKFSESNFDALLRCALHIDDTTDDRRNYQSVMITPNNSLRQKHQNIVAAPDDLPVKDTNCCKPGILQLIQSTGNQSTDNEMRKHQSPEEKIVDGILDMRLEEKDILAKHPKTMSSPLTPPLPNSPMQMRLSSPVYANPGLINAKPNVPTSMQSGLPAGLQGLPAGLQGMPTGLQGLPAGLQMSGMPPTLQVAGMQPLPMQGGMQPSGIQGGGNQGQGMQGNQLPSGMQQSGLQGSGMQPGMQPGMQSMQSVGITNSALNASLGLPIRPIPNPLGLPIQGVPAPVMPNAGMGGGNLQGGMGGGQMQPGGGGIPPYPNATGIPGLTSANSSLFMSQNPNNPAIGTQGDIPMPNQHGQSNIFPMHGLQHSASQAAFGSSIYSNIMQQTQTQPPLAPQNAGEMWYYEDPTQNIQGPFSSKEMYNWYRAGFFSPSLMVRRACENHLHPLGSYGPVVPFAQLDMMPSFPMSSGFERSPGQHESMLNSQPGLGLDSVMNITNLNEAPTMDSMQFGSVGLIRNPPYGHQQAMVDSLWGQPSPSADLLWMQQAMSRNDARVNNLPMYFWDQQPSAIASNALLPEEIAKEMKTEDQILAQLRASQKVGAPVVPDAASAPTPAPAKLDEFAAPAGATPDMGELHKLIQKDTLAAKPVPEPESAEPQVQTKPEKIAKPEPKNETDNAKAQQQQQQQQQQHQQQQQQQTKPAPETKQAKQAKNETEKSKNKENSTAKSKNKKKEEKKEDLESKPKEEELIKSEKRSNEPSPAKSKKEDKTNKKELEKEKKEWLKEGFTIVKGSEKSTNKDNKKKAEEAKAVEEAERKRKEEEKLVAEEDKKRKQAEASVRKQQETQQQQQRQAAESVVKKAPWSAVTNQGMFATSKDGLTLTEIQRLEREKKLEQIKEQQQMMQIIAQQQAAALAREQEMQAGLGWAKKKGNNANAPGQSLAEIQAEARKQAQAAAAAVAAAAAAQALEEAALPPTNHVPWGNAPNGGGFWDTQPNQPSKTVDKPQESPKVAPEPKKKKPTVNVNTTAVKKETSPAVEFESWCTTVLASWSSKIDVPTFVGFLKDIESPYEVKDYVKCYLGESKDSNDFSRQFLERRSKLLRVGMVTPSDDLCSPAMAVNPRTTSTSDYQEVKGKGKKTKKNKMLKVDARILGFSVTASEDRINVGDIDTV